MNISRKFSRKLFNTKQEKKKAGRGGVVDLVPPLSVSTVLASNGFKKLTTSW